MRREYDDYEFEILYYENLGLILCIRKVSGPSIGPDTGYRDGFSWYSSAAPDKTPE
jgi:hypothetical protein